MHREHDKRFDAKSITKYVLTIVGGMTFFCFRRVDIARVLVIFAGLFSFGVFIVRAANYYVRPSATCTNTADQSPYTNWNIAATNIQWAVDAATNASGDIVWVTNGVYSCSGVSTCSFAHWYVSGNVITNTAMVVITNPITVRSVNGYSNTIVDGNYPAWTTRVFLVANPGAMLSGLTITNGVVITGYVSSVGAGVYLRAGSITNCLITGNGISNNNASPYLHGSAVALETGTVAHCIIKGNWVWGGRARTPGIYAFGIGAYNRMITDCQIMNNSGANSPLRLEYEGSTAKWCVVYNNPSGYGGESAGNSAYFEWCIFSNNYYGINFAERGNMRNCLIVNNSGWGVRIGYAGARFWDCTIANNGSYGINADNLQSDKERPIVNCIVFNNGTGGTQNWNSTNISYTNCCLFPTAPGPNNITNAPLFVDTNAGNWRLAANSPCINRGTNQSWMTNYYDLDGRTRIRYGTVDMGAYECIYEGTIYKLW